MEPPCATSSSFQVHCTPCFAKRLMISSAMSSKFSVASARMVGPAPDRQIPSRPACVRGVTLCSTSARPGTRILRYGWCTRSCIAGYISSACGGSIVSAAVSTARRCRLNTRSCVVYAFGRTPRESAVDSSNSGMIATHLMAGFQLYLTCLPMSVGGRGGTRPVSSPPDGSGSTSASGISRRSTSCGVRSRRNEPQKEPIIAAVMLSG